MNAVKRVLLGLSFFIFFLLSIHTLTFASPYGECPYGNGTYNDDTCATPTPGSGSRSSSAGTSTSVTAGSGCTNTAPSSAPDLFQINTTNTTATLYFTPAGKPYDNYSFSYGTTSEANQYGGGFELTNASGVISFTIQELDPNTTYYFKVSASNGCAGGTWSNTVTAKTTGNKNQSGIFYKNTVTKIISNLRSIIKQNPIKDAQELPPQKATSTQSAPSQKLKSPPPKTQTTPKKTSNSSGNPFGNFFHSLKFW